MCGNIIINNTFWSLIVNHVLQAASNCVTDHWWLEQQLKQTPTNSAVLPTFHMRLLSGRFKSFVEQPIFEQSMLETTYIRKKRRNWESKQCNNENCNYCTIFVIFTSGVIIFSIIGSEYISHLLRAKNFELSIDFNVISFFLRESM